MPSAAAWSPDGKRLASAGNDRPVVIWDAATGERPHNRGHTDWVDAVAWSPDGSRVLSAGIDNSVRLWDPRTGEEAFVLRGDHGMFHDVTWHPGGAKLAAAASDGRVWIWDATPGFERDSKARAEPFVDRLIAAAPATNPERLYAARLAHDHRRFRRRHPPVGRGLADHPALGDDRAAGLRYHAARAAGMAAAGTRPTPRPSAGKALDWLTAKAAAWHRHLAPRARLKTGKGSWLLSGWAPVRPAVDRPPRRGGAGATPGRRAEGVEALWADAAAALKAARTGVAAHHILRTRHFRGSRSETTGDRNLRCRGRVRRPPLSDRARDHAWSSSGRPHAHAPFRRNAKVRLWPTLVVQQARSARATARRLRVWARSPFRTLVMV